MKKIDVESAFGNIKSEIYFTKALYSKGLSKSIDSEVFLKLENQQLTGSFKIRGAINKLKILLQKNPDIRKVVAASTGNHAAAVSYAASKLGLKEIIFAPNSISESKKHNLKKQNIDLRLYGKQSVEAEVYARHFAEENKLPFVHPYSDLDIIAGQGTIALELMQQVDNFDAVYAPIGGGGLISGIAHYLKSLNPNIKIIGCQPQNASEMYDSIKKGKIVEPSTAETIADGTAGGLDLDTCTFEFCKNYVDEIVLVSEEEISEAVYLIYKFHNLKVEPAAALSVASILKSSKRLGNEKNIAVISGSKITDERFKNIISKFTT